MTDPLPPVKDDPSILGGRTVHQDYTSQAQKIRADVRATKLAQAEQIAALWEASTARLTELWTDLQARRRQRIEELEQLVPMGPGIPEGTNPADAQVLHQAFRASLTMARNAGRPERQTMLADADKYGDDLLRRAVLSAALDDGDQETIGTWAARNGHAADIEELTYLRAVISGQHFDHRWAVQAFRAIEKPREAWNLPHLQAAAGRGATS